MNQQKKENDTDENNSEEKKLLQMLKMYLIHMKRIIVKINLMIMMK